MPCWSVPRGDGMLYNGGTLATAGGLVVQGTAQGFLEFHDVATGETLHSIETGTGIMAAPMSYEQDGVQYIAVMAGFADTLSDAEAIHLYLTDLQHELFEQRGNSRTHE